LLPSRDAKLMELLKRTERITANIAKLPDLLRK
jgi:hypothetical protein